VNYLPSPAGIESNASFPTVTHRCLILLVAGTGHQSSFTVLFKPGPFFIDPGGHLPLPVVTHRLPPSLPSPVVNCRYPNSLSSPTVNYNSCNKPPFSGTRDKILSQVVRPVVFPYNGRHFILRTGTGQILPSRPVQGSWQSVRRAP